LSLQPFNAFVLYPAAILQLYNALVHSSASVFSAWNTSKFLPLPLDPGARIPIDRQFEYACLQAFKTLGVHPDGSFTQAALHFSNSCVQGLLLVVAPLMLKMSFHQSENPSGNPWKELT